MAREQEPPDHNMRAMVSQSLERIDPDEEGSTDEAMAAPTSAPADEGMTDDTTSASAHEGMTDEAVADEVIPGSFRVSGCPGTRRPGDPEGSFDHFIPPHSTQNIRLHMLTYNRRSTIHIWFCDK